MELRSGTATQAIKKMQGQRLAEILEYVAPVIVTALLTGSENLDDESSENLDDESGDLYSVAYSACSKSA
jgi:hypothetical protein